MVIHTYVLILYAKPGIIAQNHSSVMVILMGVSNGLHPPLPINRWPDVLDLYLPVLLNSNGYSEKMPAALKITKTLRLTLLLDAINL